MADLNLHQSGRVTPERISEAVMSAFCKATGEPIVMDAIDAAQRHREALERIAAWSGEITRGEGLGYEGPRDIARKALGHV